jgi:hypothetical protein
VALALAVPPERAIAPLGPGLAAVGGRVDLVVRGPEDLRARDPAGLKLLLSDAATDAPVSSAKISLELFGPSGFQPLRGDASPGSAPGSYWFSTTFPGAGRFAIAATVGQSAASDLLAAEGLDVSLPESRQTRSSPLWPFALGVVAALLLFAALRSLRRPAATAALLLLAAGDARAHGPFTPPPASVPGANVYLSQEVQFALGLRTAPARVEAFEPPAGGGAARTFIGLPRSAVVERDGHKLIFVRVAPERFVAREPKLGWSKLDDQLGGVARVAVLDGLQLDEKVVVEGAAFLRNGGAEVPGRSIPEEAGFAGRRAEAEGRSIKTK